jgi:triacylglycerol esterase/lipase EstA (alpha/beta hydrolase family)
VAGPHHLVLVPGFFGFANLGDFAYFGHVRDLLAEVGPAAGLDGEIRVVLTEPSSSLPRRAALLAESIHRLLEQRGGMVSIVGHSTGALDARLLLSPGSLLPTRVDVERCAGAVRAVVGVAAPHHGTPLAQHFTSLFGSQLLRLLSLATVYSLRTGRLPMGVALRLARLLRRKNSSPTGVVDQLFLQLLSDFAGKRRRAIEEFFSSVRSDQGLVPQLAPGAMELFNAATADRPGVRYGQVITRARPPGLRSLGRAGLSGYAQTTHALYVVLYRLARGRPSDPSAKLSPEDRKFLRRAYGSIPDHRANDGIVPTLSQVRNQLVAAVWADHHDVLGHFHRPRHVPPHFDWVASGTGFDREHFEAVWKAVARFIGESV